VDYEKVKEPPPPSVLSVSFSLFFVFLLPFSLSLLISFLCVDVSSAECSSSSLRALNADLSVVSAMCGRASNVQKTVLLAGREEEIR
jgi:hypothetical protein